MEHLVTLGIFLLSDMEKMKTGAILANMGHSNTEIDVARYNQDHLKTIVDPQAN